MSVTSSGGGSNIAVLWLLWLLGRLEGLEDLARGQRSGQLGSKQKFDLLVSHLREPFFTESLWHYPRSLVLPLPLIFILLVVLQNPWVVREDHHLHGTKFALFQLLLQPNVLVPCMVRDILTTTSPWRKGGRERGEGTSGWSMRVVLMIRKRIPPNQKPKKSQPKL
jgi:hypothetical protein